MRATYCMLVSKFQANGRQQGMRLGIGVFLTHEESDYSVENVGRSLQRFLDAFGSNIWNGKKFASWP